MTPRQPIIFSAKPPKMTQELWDNVDYDLGIAYMVMTTAMNYVDEAYQILHDHGYGCREIKHDYNTLMKDFDRFSKFHNRFVINGQEMGFCIDCDTLRKVVDMTFSKGAVKQICDATDNLVSVARQVAKISNYPLLNDALNAYDQQCEQTQKTISNN